MPGCRVRMYSRLSWRTPSTTRLPRRRATRAKISASGWGPSSQTTSTSSRALRNVADRFAHRPHRLEWPCERRVEGQRDEVDLPSDRVARSLAPGVEAAEDDEPIAVSRRAWRRRARRRDRRGFRRPTGGTCNRCRPPPALRRECRRRRSRHPRCHNHRTRGERHFPSATVPAIGFSHPTNRAASAGISRRCARGSGSSYVPRWSDHGHRDRLRRHRDKGVRGRGGPARDSRLPGRRRRYVGPAADSGVGRPHSRGRDGGAPGDEHRRRGRASKRTCGLDITPRNLLEEVSAEPVAQSNIVAISGNRDLAGRPRRRWRIRSLDQTVTEQTQQLHAAIDRVLPGLQARAENETPSRQPRRSTR